MVRVAIFLTIFTWIGFHDLPQWRARFTEPFYERCLETTPNVKHQVEIQALVCGRSLPHTTERDDWRNLGLIHILVVSGGHLSILAAMLMNFSRLRRRSRGRSLSRPFISCSLFLFSLANRFQPPVLRSLVEWFLRRRLPARGWRNSEIALVSTWIALPFSSSIYDLLSLALSFFAAVTVELTARRYYRRRWLAAVAVQIAVWWILLPFLFTMGVPHPLTAMLNLFLAPLLGATIVPLAMLAWLSGNFPAWSGYREDPLYFGVIFDEIWQRLGQAMSWLATHLPAASPALPVEKLGFRPLVFGFETTSVLIFAIFAATGALLIRLNRETRRESLHAASAQRLWTPALIVAGAIGLAILVHHGLGER